MNYCRLIIVTRIVVECTIVKQKYARNSQSSFPDIEPNARCFDCNNRIAHYLKCV